MLQAMLERYLALGNDREEYFELTTPLFINKDKVYSLLVPGYKVSCPLIADLKNYCTR